MFQVYYSHIQDTCGFAIIKLSKDKHSRVAVCKLTDSYSNNRNHEKRENTCFTATLDSLEEGDQLFIKEEAGRTSVFTPGMSFFGIVNLVPN